MKFKILNGSLSYSLRFHDFFERPDQFQEELVQDLFKPPKDKKIEHPYIYSQVQDAETIEIETKKEDDEFFDLEQKSNAIDGAATEQKKQNDLDRFS